MENKEIEKKLDDLWKVLEEGQLTNPWINIQQISYLLYIKSLDDEQIKQERRVNDQRIHGLNAKLNNPIFKEGNYINKEKRIDVPYKNLRWSIFKEFNSERILENLKYNVFPFIKDINKESNSSLFSFLEKADLVISDASTLDSVIKILSDDELKFNNAEQRGKNFEYLISKINTGGKNGKYKTPRHIIDLMIELAKPKINDVIIDPAMGTGGFLIKTANYLKNNFPNEYLKKENIDFYNKEMFNGFDSDLDMFKIGYMNLKLNNVEKPNVLLKNTISKEYLEENKYSLVLSNPPFNGKIDNNVISDSLNLISGKSKKTELLFISLYLRLLKVGGRCVSIVPSGFLNNSNAKSYNKLREELVNNQKLEAIIYLPEGVFKIQGDSKSGKVSTCIIVFTKTNNGGTDKVWLYKMENDGYSLDAKRSPISLNDIPDIINRYNNLEKENERTLYDNSFFISKKEIQNNDYILSWNKYHKRIVEKKVYRTNKEIFNSLDELEKEFDMQLKELKDKFGD